MGEQYSEGRRSYDFSEIPAWVSEKAKITDIEEKHKSAANMWASKGLNLFDEVTGEIIQPAAIKYSKPILTKKTE